MIDDVFVDMISACSEESEITMATSNDDEFIAYARNVLSIFDGGEIVGRAITPEAIERLSRLVDIYQRSVRNEKITQQYKMFASARIERAADAILLNMNCRETGH